MSQQHKAEQLVSRLSPRLGADIHNEVRLAFGIAGTVRENVARNARAATVASHAS
jgi:hypothetical protein